MRPYDWQKTPDRYEYCKLYKLVIDVIAGFL